MKQIRMKYMGLKIETKVKKVEVSTLEILNLQSLSKMKKLELMKHK